MPLSHTHSLHLFLFFFWFLSIFLFIFMIIARSSPPGLSFSFLFSSCNSIFFYFCLIYSTDAIIVHLRRWCSNAQCAMCAANAFHRFTFTIWRTYFVCLFRIAQGIITEWLVSTDFYCFFVGFNWFSSASVWLWLWVPKLRKNFRNKMTTKAISLRLDSTRFDSSLHFGIQNQWQKSVKVSRIKLKSTVVNRCQQKSIADRQNQSFSYSPLV